MNDCALIIIIIILFLIAIIALSYYCGRRRIISHFTPTEGQMTGQLGYANIDEPYNKPFVLHNAITNDQCKQIMDFAKDKLVDSEVVGGKNMHVRNSQQCWIPKNSPIARPIYEKISKIFNIPIENAEDLQVVRYLPGQYFNEHHDSCCDNNDKCSAFAKKGGQRALTVLIYLNNEFSEGHTYFKNLNTMVKPPAGNAVVFYPLAVNTSKCHPLALHAGMPVTEGEKWIANIWFRESKFVA
jgi:prolyl 4-hydroxylase